MKKYTFFSSFILICLLFMHSSNENEFTLPTKYTNISSEYGYRELYGSSNFHNGIDFLAPQGSEVYASSSGYISFAGFSYDGYGNTIIITHSNNIKTLYCHLSENFLVHVGQHVNCGDLIGFVGPKVLSNGVQNGNTTGPHLHFTVFVNNLTINPFDIITFQ